MTGLLHEKEFSRTAFIKGGGAMVVAVSGAASMIANAAATTITTADNFGYPVESGAWDPPTADHPSAGTFAQRTAQDYLNQVAGINNVDAWLTVNADNTVTVTHGETEVGHGTPSGILMIVAEEMNMSMEQMWYARPESWLQYTGGGAGSSGISSRSTEIRLAAAYAKQWLLTIASTKLNVPIANLTVTNGVISGGSTTLTYGQLVNGQTFASILPAGTSAKVGTSTFPTSTTSALPGVLTNGVVKPVSQYTIVGNSYPRIDIPAKVAATYTYIQNVRVPGMLHMRRVRPRGSGANTFENDTPLSVNTASIANIPGAAVVQINNFIAVTAPEEYDAIQAAAQLEVEWQTQSGFPQGSGNYWTWLREASQANTLNVPRYGSKTNATSGATAPQILATAAHTVTATYHYHYNQYVPIGPHCAVADIAPGGATGIVYVQGQSITGLGASGFPALIGAVLNPASPSSAAPLPQNIRVVWYEGSASYGSGVSLEVGEEAVIVSTKIGKPVRNQWMRWDQQGWDDWGPAQMYDVTMGSDANGNIIAANWQAFGQDQANIDETQRLLGLTSWPAAPGPGGIAPVDTAVYNQQTFVGGSGYTGAVTGAHWAVYNTQPLYGGSIKGSFIRAPSAPQGYFAGEQIVDELAHANNMDPVAFRAQNIDITSDQGSTIGLLGARWRSVLDAATQQAGWNWSEIKQNLSQTGTERKGRGFAFGTFASTQIGMVADIKVNMVTGKISVLHLTIAQNNGITVSVQGVGNQMSGSAIMGVSRCMVEEATWNTERLTTVDWVTYPILRMADCPSVTLVNVHPGQYTVVVPGDMTTATNPGTSVTVGNTNAYNGGWVATGSGEPPLSACGSAIANAFFNATGARIRYAPMTPATARGALKAAGVLMT